MFSNKDTKNGVQTCVPRETQAVKVHCTLVWCSGLTRGAVVVVVVQKIFTIVLTFTK